MSYRPHKRKRATCLKGKCVEYIGDNLHKVFEAGVLDIKLREQILEYLCETPMLVELPDGAFPFPISSYCKKAFAQQQHGTTGVLTSSENSNGLAALLAALLADGYPYYSVVFALTCVN